MESTGEGGGGGGGGGGVSHYTSFVEVCVQGSAEIRRIDLRELPSAVLQPASCTYARQNPAEDDRVHETRGGGGGGLK